MTDICMCFICQSFCDEPVIGMSEAMKKANFFSRIEQSVSGVGSLLKQELINTKYYITVLGSNHYILAKELQCVHFV